MKPYKHGKGSGRRWGKIGILLVVSVIVIIIGGYAVVNNMYQRGLQPVNVNASEDIRFTVVSGSTTAQIAESLHEKQLIRAPRVFVQYVRSNELGEKFIAGTYKLRQSMGVEEIVAVLTEGSVAEDLFTIYPGSNLDQIKAVFKETTHFGDAEIEAALDPARYSGHPALVDLPAGASLEGFLYPDSYQFIAETVPQTIIEQSLDEMAEALSPEVRSGIAAQGLSVYQGIVLASIVEREVGERDSSGQISDNRAKVAQVFLKRLQEGMRLESNATDDYPPEYDTYSIAGLPPAPISNVSISSLKAVAFPASSDYLYFVAGTDCVTRFSRTNDQHEALKSAHGVARPEDNCRG